MVVFQQIHTRNLPLQILFLKLGGTISVVLSLPSEASNEFAASDQEYVLTSSLVGQQTLSNINGASSIGIYFLKDGHHSEWAVTISEEAKCPVALNSNSYNAEGGLALEW